MAERDQSGRDQTTPVQASGRLQHHSDADQRASIMLRLHRGGRSHGDKPGDLLQHRRAGRHGPAPACLGSTLLNPAAEFHVDWNPDGNDDDGGGEGFHGLASRIRNRKCSRRHRQRRGRAHCWDDRWHRPPSRSSDRFWTPPTHRLHRSCRWGRRTSKLLLTSQDHVFNCSISRWILSS